MRRVMVFTGSRAEYGLLRPVMRFLKKAPDVELRVLVSGSHLRAEYGLTLERIHEDGFTDCLQADILPAPGSHRDLYAIMARALECYGQIMKEMNPELLLILGDRYETFCAAAAATALAIPIAHVHGGEVTLGAQDDAYRHAITKMGHLHFTATEIYRRRVIHMGELPDRVWNVGSLGVENIRTLPLPGAAQVRGLLKIEPPRPYLLCTFHPATRQPGMEIPHITALLNSLAAFPEYAVVFTAANADPGGDMINHLLREQARKSPGQFCFFPSLGVEEYLAAARDAACVVGNSSSGIIEVPSLGTPVIDIGDRQGGRVRANSVLHCAPMTDEIRQVLHHALSPEWKNWCRLQPNPYEKPGSARVVSECLRTYPLKGILQKKFHDFFPDEKHELESAMPLA